MILYTFLRSFCRVALGIFYREVQVIGNVDPGGPLILVANHPSTLNDALLVACQMDRPVSIIAKGSLFANPLSAAFLRSCGVLPVMRREYEAAGQSEAKNEDTFEAIYECLRDNGVVLIFGEGTSHLEKRLMPLKTGAARMAIGAEERFGPLGVRLIPVGLNYEDPQAFGISVQIRFGEPLPALPFLDRAGDNREAARELTNQVEAALAQEVVHLEAPDVEDVLVTIDRWIRRDYVGEGMNRLDVTRAIAQMLNRAAREQPQRLESFKLRLRDYQSLLQQAKLSDDALLDRRPLQLQEIALIGLVFPLWLYGAVNHYVPYKFPKLAIALLKIDPVYDSTVRLMTGIFAFVISYAAQSLLVAWAFGWMLAIIYLVTLPAFGVIALEALDSYYALKKRLALRRQRAAAKKDDLEKALKLRSELFEALQEGRQALDNEGAVPISESSVTAEDEPGEEDPSGVDPARPDDVKAPPPQDAS